MKAETLRRRLVEYTEQIQRAVTDAKSHALRAEQAAEAADIAMSSAELEIVQSMSSVMSNMKASHETAAKLLEKASMHAASTKSAADVAHTEAQKAAGAMEPCAENVKQALQALDDSNVTAASAITVASATPSDRTERKASKPEWVPPVSVDRTPARRTVHALTASPKIVSSIPGAEINMKISSAEYRGIQSRFSTWIRSLHLPFPDCAYKC